jgi:hypothetical protein
MTIFLGDNNRAIADVVAHTMGAITMKERKNADWRKKIPNRVFSIMEFELQQRVDFDDPLYRKLVLEHDWQKVPNIGPKSIQQIKDCIDEFWGQ